MIKTIVVQSLSQPSAWVTSSPVVGVGVWGRVLLSWLLSSQVWGGERKVRTAIPSLSLSLSLSLSASHFKWNLSEAEPDCQVNDIIK